MSREWLLVEVLGTEPTVAAIGTQPRNLVPVAAVLRRNRHLPTIVAAIERCRASGTPIHEQTPAGDRSIHVHPVALTPDYVHGVQLWFGPTEDNPPPRPVVGAYRADMDLSTSTSTTEFAEVMGIDPDNQAETRSLAEDFTRILPNENDLQMFSSVVNPASGASFCVSCPVSDDYGTVRYVLFAGRTLHESNGNGNVDRVSRSVVMRVDDPEDEPRVMLAQQILEAVSTPGRHRAVLNISNFAILRWIDEPYPDLAWEYNPDAPAEIHPDDMANVRAMRFELANGTTSGNLRVRAKSGGWLSIHVSATRFELQEDAYAALATISAAERPARD